MLSLVIRNAQLVDGSGKPAYRGDLGVEGDRIAAVGRVDGTGAQEIDAGGKVLAPGFIDIHTHYDPQLCWDRNATPTPEHGVTSLVAKKVAAPQIDCMTEQGSNSVGTERRSRAQPWRGLFFKDGVQGLIQSLELLHFPGAQEAFVHRQL